MKLIFEKSVKGRGLSIANPISQVIKNICLLKQLFDKLELAYLSLTKHPTMDISNPTDAALIAMKLFIAKAMPTKLTHTPTMPILIPFIQSHSFVKSTFLKLELAYFFFSANFLMLLGLSM